MFEHTIQKLPEELINQIKAGEVVERPASVVKELVENSIDAKATSIVVELLDGGKQLIRITDNGIGISGNDLALSLERHATSKLKDFSDLEKISSFGFRGEALPSIASVSEFCIKSKPNSQSLGKEVFVSQGKIREQNDISHAPGTTIQVKDLFCNVPARLKFLKSTSTEYTHIHDFLLSIAFYYHSISFKLNHNGRDIFHYKQKETSLKRFEEILGVQAQDYAAIKFERGSFKISGFSLLPEKATSLPQYFVTFVNGRLVKDKIIRAGVLQGYQGLLMKGLSPSSVVFIEVDPTWIDVNVHPAKIEVRFSDPLGVQELISMGIQNSIKKEINISMNPTSYNKYENIQKKEPPVQTHHQQENKFESKQRFHLNHLKTSGESFRPVNSAVPTSFTESYSAPKSSQIVNLETIIEEKKLFIEPRPSAFSNAKYIGQFNNCYLLLQKEGELWILDQHAFHERILFEEYTTEYAKHSIVKQNMLTPHILNASQRISSLAEEHKEKIDSLGFDIEILTNGNIAIHSYPAFLSPQKIQSTIEELLNKIIENEHIDQTQFYHLFYATLACHSAVRAGDPLNAELVQRLLERSNHVDFYAHCPHGRPVLRKFENKDVESWFLRI